MKSFVDLIQSHEDWLMQRILDYASKHGYTKYTSTLKEAWRLSISGLSESIIDATEKHKEAPELLAEENLHSNIVAQFGVKEAILHRNRGVSLQMFLCLFKYYRQSYLDLIIEKHSPQSEKQAASYFINRLFDIMETGFCIEWAGSSTEQKIHEMQIKNREMTNEKNKYLTIFESIPNPTFLISTEGMVENINMSGAMLLDHKSVSGELYYRVDTKPSAHTKESKQRYQKNIVEVLPWLENELTQFYLEKQEKSVFEKEVELDEHRYIFRVKIGQMLDVSRKFDGVVLILEDITSLKEALIEVKTLKGLVPICSHCKKMRDDKGYWSRLEEYIESRSEALFSHSVCHDCFEKYYDKL